MKFQFIVFLVISAIIMTGPSTFAAEFNIPDDFNTIEEALVYADLGDQVTISPGIYYEINLVLPAGVTLTGLGAQPNEVVIDAQGQGRIIWCESLESSSLIQNVTFANGAATGESVYDQSGGAILVNNSRLNLVNCHFINNSAEGHGGAIRSTHSTLQISNCHFEGNTAPEGGGGALDCSYDSNSYLQNSFFLENEALWGGALSCRGDSSPVSYQCSFSGNRASGTLGYGGAVMADHDSEPFFQLCTFYGNNARYGGALASFHDSKINLEGCTVVSNSCLFLGGGLLCIDSSPNIDNSIFAFQDGMAIASGGSSLPIINCTDIFGNDGGDWFGVIEEQLQLKGNFSLDPLFCNAEPGQDLRFHLSPDSPCGPQEGTCDLMGAWSVGCDITPIYVIDFESQWDKGTPRIFWSTCHQSTNLSFVLKRSLESDPENQIQLSYQALDLENFVAFDNLLQPKTGQNFLYHLYQVNEDDTLSLIDRVRLSGSGMLQPLRLYDAWPNPFNPLTTIRFEVSKERTVIVSVHDLRGRKVRTLAQQSFSAGQHELVWDGKDGGGRQVESGAYFIMVQSGELMETHKVLLLK